MDEQDSIRKNKSNVEGYRSRKAILAEAIKTACYVINQSPSTAIELKPLMEMWTGKVADYSRLHIFGSPVYVMYNTQEVSKLDSKSRKICILGICGWSEGVSVVGSHCP
jgi:hypothetical protein